MYLINKTDPINLRRSSLYHLWIVSKSSADRLSRSSVYLPKWRCNRKSSDFDQLNVKEQRWIGRNFPGRKSVGAVSQMRRDSKSRSLADFHRQYAFVPTFDHLSQSTRESEWDLPWVFGAPEFGSSQDGALTFNGDRVPSSHSTTPRSRGGQNLLSQAFGQWRTHDYDCASLTENWRFAWQ